MSVQARFYVAEIAKYPKSGLPGYAEPAPVGKVTLRPATRGPENKTWAFSSPSANFDMTVTGPALAWFEERLGKDVAIAFEDRPLICSKCSSEIVGQATVENEDGTYSHGYACP